MAAGVGYNPRIDGSLGVGDLGGFLCWALELGGWEPRTWRGMQLRTERFTSTVCARKARYSLFSYPTLNKNLSYARGFFKEHVT